MSETPINSDDYHDYVIQGNKLIGQFDRMYQNCENPWPETEADYEALPTTSRVPEIIKSYGLKKIFSLGCGKGKHLRWLLKKCPGIEVSGCDVSETAVQSCFNKTPEIKARVMSASDLSSFEIEFDLLIAREVVWYILEDWAELCSILKTKYQGKKIIIELSFYDQQSFGTEFFDGPDQFVEKLPFDIIEIVRFHTTSKQREGMLLIFASI